MPHRRLVRIGETPVLPTISQFLMEMAARQHEEIQRLKSEALNGTLPDPTVPEADHDNLTPDAWQLHPVRVKKVANKRPAAKRSTKSASRTKAAKAKKKPVKTSAKKTAKKVVKKKAVSRKKK